MSTNNEITHNLLKIDHLTDLGLVLFSDTVDEDGRDRYGTLCDYVPQDMPSLLPADENSELIEVFPVTDSVLLTTDGDLVDSSRSTEVILNSVDDASEIMSAPGIEISPLSTHAPPRKKCKIRRIVGQPKFKKKVIAEKAEQNASSGVKNAKLNGFCEKFNDNTELDNKINDSLLDMLQAKTGVDQISLTDCCRRTPMDKKNEKHGCKFITIFPSQPDGKIINLMVKGKVCRSKQPLTEPELRVVTKILSNEFISTEHSCDSSYKNVYYDAETDSNIRYEIQSEPVSQEIASNENISSNLSEKRPKSKLSSEGSNKEGYILNSVARTRFGRISRPPRHVVRDYKRLNETNHGADHESENCSGYADYRHESTHSTDELKNTESVIPSTLYGPLEPIKRQFSSLSRCPTCNKIYLGYRRMAIHFQKYPEHKNEELLKHLLIRNRKKALEENNSLSHILGDELVVNPDDVSLTSPTNTNVTVKKKGRLSRRLRMRGSKSHQLKELLSSFRMEDIIKYAAPMVATVLNSWEYLLLRSRKTKSDHQTLAASLLNELSLVIERLRFVSRDFLRPCEGDKESSKNILMIGEENILRYVLGLAPGQYITSENEDWAKGNPETIEVKKHNLKDEYAALCSSTVNSDEDASNLLERPSSVDRRNDEVNSFYEIVTQVPAAVTVEDLVHNIGNNPTAAMQPIVSTESEHFNYGEDESRLFSGMKSDGTISAISMERPPQLALKNENSNLTVDYIMPQSFSPSHALSFDSLVDGVDDDLMSAFPISLPMLSDNSSDSKDYKDILNSLQDIECGTEKSNVSHLEDSISNINPSESSAMDLLSTLKSIGCDGKTNMSSLMNDTAGSEPTVSNQTDARTSSKTSAKKTAVSDSNGEMPECLAEESNQIDLLNGFKGISSPHNLDIGQIQRSTSEPPCIMDFSSLDSNFP